MAFSVGGRLARWGKVAKLLGMVFGALACASTRPENVAEQTGDATQPLAQGVPTGFQEEVVASGLTEPVSVRFAPDGRMFVAEKNGRIFSYRSVNDTANPVRVVDLRTAVHNYWDRGLLGMAVDPRYPAVPNLYVLHTLDSTTDGNIPRWGTAGQTADNCPSPPGGTASGCMVYGRLSRISVDPTSQVGAEQVLLSGNWCQQYPSHSTGDLVFGRDGYLYASAGDGASFNQADWGQLGDATSHCDDPANEGGALRSQDLLSPGDPTSFDGTLLRIDVSGSQAVAPADNPLIGGARSDDDFIVAMGLRNPYRITARPGSSEIWIADVGWNDWEEINRFDSVGSTIKNYGWPCYEGNGQQSGYASRALCQMLYGGTAPANINLRAPYYTYAHSANVVAGDGCGTGSSSVTGLAFNTNPSFPAEYQNALFFADATRQCVWTMFAGSNGQPDPNQRAVFVRRSSGRIVDIQMGPDGALYYVDLDGGSVVRVAYFRANTPPVAQLGASKTSGPTPLVVDFDASSSSDAEDGHSLTFAWDLDADGAFDDGNGPTASYRFDTAGTHVVQVRVTDSGGASRSASVTISADDSPPVPVIDTPSSELLFSVGDTISFAGHADDPDTGPLPPERLSWTLVVHHCYTVDNCHSHTLTSYEQIASGSFTAPDHEYPAYLELELTATDAASGGDWLDPAWGHRISLTLPASLTFGTLTDVPVLVRLDPTRIDYEDTEPGGADLRFTDAQGNLLPYEIDHWDPMGASYVWVKLPRLSSAEAGSKLYLYFHNHGATSAEAPTAVWSNGYRAVWHLGQDLRDSSGRGNVGTPFGAVAGAGIAGEAYSFNGTTAYLNMGADPSLAVATNLSLEAWVKIGNTNRDGYDRVLCKKTLWDATSGYDLELHPLQNLVSSLGSGADYTRATGVDLDTSWHYLGSSIAGTSGSLYVDGVNRTTDGSISRVVANNQPLNIGRRSGNGDYFLGSIDEVRVSDVARPAGYFQAQTASMRDQLFRYGTVEHASALGASTSVTLYPRTVDLQLVSVPPGIPISVGSETISAPGTKRVIDKSVVSLSAPAAQVIGGVSYVFDAWSDGGAAAHVIQASSATSTLTATYRVQQTVPTCTDGAKNGTETGTDCGGSCPGCPIGTACNGNADCSSTLCQNGSCVAVPTCTDGIKNGSETGVDCGGSCPGCPIGTACNGNADCSSTLCQNGSCVAVPTCTDGIKNGSETGVDCGGSCSPCSTCTPTVYQAETMTHSTGGAVTGGWNIWSNGYISTNHAFAGGATTVTVYARGSVAQGVWPNMVVSAGNMTIGGGSVTATSFTAYTFSFTATPGTSELRLQFTNDLNQNGEDRNLYVDRVEISCGSTPPTPTCTDGAKNGDETGTNCGGSCATDCPNGQGCSVNGDCISNRCVSGTCQPAVTGGAVTASITLTSTWSSGYCADLTIKNGKSLAISTWSVALNLNQSTITSSWNANFGGTGANRTVTPISWNGALGVDASTTVGFCANRTGSNWQPVVTSATGN